MDIFTKWKQKLRLFEVHKTKTPLGPIPGVLAIKIPQFSKLLLSLTSYIQTELTSRIIFNIYWHNLFSNKFSIILVKEDLIIYLFSWDFYRLRFTLGLATWRQILVTATWNQIVGTGCESRRKQQLWWSPEKPGTMHQNKKNQLLFSVHAFSFKMMHDLLR
jgi:hypothetical protein